MENMCGLSLPWAAPVADFAARHALSAAATAELESLFAASQANPSPSPNPNPSPSPNPNPSPNL